MYIYTYIYIYIFWRACHPGDPFVVVFVATRGVTVSGCVSFVGWKDTTEMIFINFEYELNKG